MYHEGLFHVSCVYFGIALIWVCMLLWKVGGADWDVALGFTQVVAASIAILVTSVAGYKVHEK